MESSDYVITELPADDKGIDWDVDTREEYRKMTDWIHHMKRTVKNSIPSVHPQLYSGKEESHDG